MKKVFARLTSQLDDKLQNARKVRDAMQVIEDRLAKQNLGKKERKSLKGEFSRLQDKRDQIISSIGRTSPNRIKDSNLLVNIALVEFSFKRSRALKMAQSEANGTLEKFVKHYVGVFENIAKVDALLKGKKPPEKINYDVDTLRAELDIALTRKETRLLGRKGFSAISWEIARQQKLENEEKVRKAELEKSAKNAPSRRAVKEDDPIDILSQHFDRRRSNDPDRRMNRNHAAEKALYKRLHPWDEYPISEDEKIHRDREVEQILYGSQRLNPDY